MESQLEKILQVQKESWNKSSTGWKKWDGMMMKFLEPVGREMIEMLELEEDHTILDIATGTGEPGLTIAPIVKRGKVVATDLSEDMLAVARENAEKRGLTNFETVCCDISETPFDDNQFDGICCRFGIMFFPDIRLATNELMRVLKPGGRLVISYWNVPELNPWISSSMETMIRQLKLNPPPGAPGLFRCCEPGMMAGLFIESGLSQITETVVRGELPCHTIETYWAFITEVACPMSYSKADPELQLKIKDEILEKIKRRFPDGKIVPGSSAMVLGGVKE